MTLWTACLGVITNVLIANPIGGYYSVAFMTGTPTACRPQIVVENKKRIVAIYNSEKSATADFYSNQVVIMRIKELK
jgi:hypothetical protein